jgi:hypothetical protein
MAGETFQRGEGSARFSSVWQSWSPHLPSRRRRTATRRKSRVGRSGYDLGAGLTGCDGGIDDQPREEGFLASLSPPFYGKMTEVARELD